MACCPPYSLSSCVCMCLELHEKLYGEAQTSTSQTLSLIKTVCGNRAKTHGEGSSRIWSNADRRAYGRSASSALSGPIWRLGRRCWACTQGEGCLGAAAQSAPYTCTQFKVESFTVCHCVPPHISPRRACLRSKSLYVCGGGHYGKHYHQKTKNLPKILLEIWEMLI